MDNERLKMVEAYRKTMTSDVLHSWAIDAQAELSALRQERDSLRMAAISGFEALALDVGGTDQVEREAEAITELRQALALGSVGAAER